MYAIFVTLKVKAAHVEEFKKASFGDAEGSVRDEPACFRFDINQSPDDPTTFYLYEVYENEAALGTHRSTPHFTKWLGTVKDWFEVAPQRILMTTVFPSDEGWRQQKPHLLKW